MNILKSVLAAVAVRNHRRNNHYIPFPVFQRSSVKAESAGAVGTVDKFPAFMGMPGNRIIHGKFSDVGDIIHGVFFLS